MDIQEILIAAGSIDNADIRPDGTASVVAGDRRLSLGPCRGGIEVGSAVSYDGELPDGVARTGDVTAVGEDASGDQVVTVNFGSLCQDILASELTVTGWDATEYTLDGADEDGPLWRETGYTWAQTDAEMVSLAAKYAA